MVTKSTDRKEAKRGKVTVGILQLNKETVKDLTNGEQKQVKGGVAPRTAIGNQKTEADQILQAGKD